MNATIAAALVAAGASLLGLVVTLATVYWQTRAKLNELLQDQFKEILVKRIEVYPKLWRILQEQLSDWERFERPVTEEWASTFLASLLAWNADNGVFLSQQTYEAFYVLRQKAFDVVQACSQGRSPTREDLRAIHAIFYGNYTDPGTGRQHFSLATCLKNDLGAYKVPAVTVRYK
jgi:hypothetical protein